MNNKVYLLQVKCKDSDWQTTDYFSSIVAATHCLNESVRVYVPKYPFVSFRVISKTLWSKKSYFDIFQLYNLKFQTK